MPFLVRIHYYPFTLQQPLKTTVQPIAPQNQVLIQFAFLMELASGLQCPAAEIIFKIEGI